MDKINFTGGFLLHKPTKRMWEKVYTEIVPKNKRVIINDLYEDGNVFFATKSIHDSNILKYLLTKRTLNLTYYPNISTKTRLDSYFPDEAVKTLDNELAISDKKEIRKHIKKEIINSADSLRALKYRWKENDYIAQTYKALKITPENYKAKTKNHITTLYDQNGNIAARVSPNTQQGTNYAYIYPSLLSDKFKMVVIDYNGEIIGSSSNIDLLAKFRKKFHQAVRTDYGRISSAKNS